MVLGVPSIRRKSKKKLPKESEIPMATVLFVDPLPWCVRMHLSTSGFVPIAPQICDAVLEICGDFEKAGWSGGHSDLRYGHRMLLAMALGVIKTGIATVAYGLDDDTAQRLATQIGGGVSKAHVDDAFAGFDRNEHLTAEKLIAPLIVNTTGRVSDCNEDGDYEVTGRFRLCDYAAMRQDAEKYSDGHGGWTGDMNHHIGKVGRVIKVLRCGDVVLEFEDGRRYRLADRAIEPRSKEETEPVMVTPQKDGSETHNIDELSTATARVPSCTPDEAVSDAGTSSLNDSNSPQEQVGDDLHEHVKDSLLERHLFHWQDYPAGNQRKAVSLSDLAARYVAGETNKTCLVWASGYTQDWTNIGDLPDLYAYLERRARPLPQSPVPLEQSVTTPSIQPTPVMSSSPLTPSPACSEASATFYPPLGRRPPPPSPVTGAPTPVSPRFAEPQAASNPLPSPDIHVVSRHPQQAEESLPIFKFQVRTMLSDFPGISLAYEPDCNAATARDLGVYSSNEVFYARLDKENWLAVCQDSTSSRTLGWLSASDAICMDNIVDCPICMSSLKKQDLVTFPYMEDGRVVPECEHGYCNVCIKAYLLNAIQHDGAVVKTGRLTCPDSTCEQPISYQIAKNILSADEFKLFVDACARGLQKKFLRPCVKCGNISEKGDGDVARCQYRVQGKPCNHTFCPRCGRDPHRSKSCDEVVAEELTRYGLAKAGVKLIPCPQCHSPCERQAADTCDKATCPVCNHIFCVECLVDYELIKRTDNKSHKPNCKHYRSDDSPACTLVGALQAQNVSISEQEAIVALKKHQGKPEAAYLDLATKYGLT